MKDPQPQAAAADDQKPTTIPSPAQVLAASIARERARKEVDEELIQALESTVLRVDAAEAAWDKASAAIRALAAARAESRTEER